MMRKAGAKWIGSLATGHGRMRTESGQYQGDFTRASRLQENGGTNPEELIGAAHAGCYSMALTATLEKAGFQPKLVETAASVHVEKQNGGIAITRVELDARAEVPGIDQGRLQKEAEEAGRICVISKALSGTQIIISATLLPTGTAD